MLNFYIKRDSKGKGYENAEICGILHSSMPIVIESVSPSKFVNWLYNYE